MKIKQFDKRHCGAQGCKCTHEGICNAGWLEVDGPVPQNEQPIAKPCWTCFPSLAAIVQSSTSQAELSYRARQRSAQVTVEQEYLIPEAQYDR